MANRADPDRMSHSAVSDQGIHCLLRLVCRNTLGKQVENDKQVYIDKDVRMGTVGCLV